MQTTVYATIAKNSQAIETTVGAETVLMMIESGRCYGLGETGSEVWRQLAAPTSMPELIERLRTIYDAPEGIVEKDVHELIEQLRHHKLVLLD